MNKEAAEAVSDRNQYVCNPQGGSAFSLPPVRRVVAPSAPGEIQRPARPWLDPSWRRSTRTTRLRADEEVASGYVRVEPRVDLIKTVTKDAHSFSKTTTAIYLYRAFFGPQLTPRQPPPSGRASRHQASRRQAEACRAPRPYHQLRLGELHIS